MMIASPAGPTASSSEGSTGATTTTTTTSAAKKQLIEARAGSAADVDSEQVVGGANASRLESTDDEETCARSPSEEISENSNNQSGQRSVSGLEAKQVEEEEEDEANSSLPSESTDTCEEDLLTTGCSSSQSPSAPKVNGRPAFPGAVRNSNSKPGRKQKNPRKQSGGELSSASSGGSPSLSELEQKLEGKWRAVCERRAREAATRIPIKVRCAPGRWRARRPPVRLPVRL